MVIPSTLAVLRLTTSWYLVGACTGRSAGFSPLRMRRAPVRVDYIRTIRNQAAGGDIEAQGIDRRQSVPRRRRSDQLAMRRRQWSPRHNQAGISSRGQMQ